MAMIELCNDSDEVLPKIHCFKNVSSTFDTAFELVEEGRLEIWDSVLARSQSAGRGQMRKKWLSPEGNLYATLRLPDAPPFNSTAAAVALGALCAQSIVSLNCPVHLKWPNDLVIEKNGEYAKVCGILLEDKKNIILAGIGINMQVAPEPESLDGDAPLPATKLENCCPDPMPSAFGLWASLVKHVFSAYKSGPVFAEIWRNLAERLLLWRNEMVEISDGQEMARGILLGIGPRGGALLQTPGGVQEKIGGSIRKARN